MNRINQISEFSLTLRLTHISAYDSLDHIIQLVISHCFITIEDEEFNIVQFKSIKASSFRHIDIFLEERNEYRSCSFFHSQLFAFF